MAKFKVGDSVKVIKNFDPELVDYTGATGTVQRAGFLDGLYVNLDSGSRVYLYEEELEKIDG